MSCTVWTTNDAGTRGRVGNSAETDQKWSDLGEGSPDAGGNTCDTMNHLYCFSDGDPFDPNLCRVAGDCVGNDTLRQECEMELAACSLGPDAQRAECIMAAVATCNPG